MGAWWWEVWWEVCWGLWLALGRAGLRTALGLAAWLLGLFLRPLSSGPLWSLGDLWGLDVGLHSACVLYSTPGPARLRSLRVLHARLQYFASWEEQSIQRAYLPESLLGALAACLLEDGSEAAPLLLAVWELCRHNRLSTRARERLFTEAFLSRLRAFFLASEDPDSQRAVLRLHSLLTRGLLGSKQYAEHCFHLLPGQEETYRARILVLRTQAARNKAFLRHPDFVGSLRGRLRGGDPGDLLMPALRIYREDADQSPLSALYDGPCYDGIIYLILPVFRDLLLNYERLPEHPYPLHTRCFWLCPTLRSLQAVEVMEDCAVPLLERAEELSPAALQCLVHVFPSDMRYRPASNMTPPLDPAVAAAGVALVSRLHGLYLAAAKSALASKRLSVAQRWVLVGSLPNGHSVQDDPELCRLLLRDLQRLPLTQEFRKLAAAAFWGPLTEAVRLTQSWGGAFGLLERLIALHTPPYGTVEWSPGGFQHFGSQLGDALRVAGFLLRPDSPKGPQGPEEATRLLLAWRDSVLGPALRRLVAEEPPPGASDLRQRARDLLQLHDDLLRDHPLQTLSRLPNEIRFPDY